MAASGLEIYNILPKTNCKECGASSCMAFAMKVAAKKASIEECRYLSQDAKIKIDGAKTAEIKTLEFGPPDRKIVIGGEKVLHRHEEAFYNKPAIAARINCGKEMAEIKADIEKISAVSLKLLHGYDSIDAVFLDAVNISPDKFKLCVEAVYANKKIPLIIKIDSREILQYAADKLAEDKPVICYEGDDEAGFDIIKNAGLAAVVNSETAASPAVQKIDELLKRGLTDFVINIEAKKPAERIIQLDTLRKLALKHKVKNAAYPVMAKIRGENAQDAYLEAALCVCKYASVIVLDAVVTEYLLPLYTMRSNLYQDPRKPIQVEARLYDIGNVDESSPVAVTTNFSLTYFTVSAEIEASRVPSYLLVVDTGGTSVLSAWASDKINAGKIAAAIKSAELENKVSHRKVIVPGYIYPVKEDLEEASGWEVLIGPKEAKDLGGYLKGL